MSVQRKQPIYLEANPSLSHRWRRVIKQLAQKRTRKMLSWFLLALGILLMSVWNWKLVVSTGSGIGLMWLVYAGLGWNWRFQWTRWQHFFKGSHGKLTLAAGSGGLAAISTYIVASIWADSENRWLATGTILQGIATLSTLVLVLWQTLTTQERGDEVKFEHWLGELTQKDPLKQLIAVRQLTHLVDKGGLSLYQQQLGDYFRLMLTQEPDKAVRDALLASLGQWNSNLAIEASRQPLQIPVPVKRSLNTVYRQI